MSFFSDILHGLVDLFYPQVCLHCLRPLLPQEQFLCTDCLLDIPLTYIIDFEQNIITKTFWARIPIKYGFSYMYFVKGGIAQSILHQLKYKKNKEIGVFFGTAMAAAMKENNFPMEFDLIVPVPLHPKKEKIRGYNQAEVIARAIGEHLNKPIVPHAIQRTRFNPTQTKMDMVQRWKNTENLFALKQPQQLRSKHLLLVDDVLTTGSTIEAMAQAILKEFPDADISVATLAIAKKATI